MQSSDEPRQKYSKQKNDNLFNRFLSFIFVRKKISDEMPKYGESDFVAALYYCSSAKRSMSRFTILIPTN